MGHYVEVPPKCHYVEVLPGDEFITSYFWIERPDTMSLTNNGKRLKVDKRPFLSAQKVHAGGDPACYIAGPGGSMCISRDHLKCH